MPKSTRKTSWKAAQLKTKTTQQRKEATSSATSGKKSPVTPREHPQRTTSTAPPPKRKANQTSNEWQNKWQKTCPLTTEDIPAIFSPLVWRVYNHKFSLTLFKCKRTVVVCLHYCVCRNKWFFVWRVLYYHHLSGECTITSLPWHFLNVSEL